MRGKLQVRFLLNCSFRRPHWAMQSQELLCGSCSVVTTPRSC